MGMSTHGLPALDVWTSHKITIEGTTHTVSGYTLAFLPEVITWIVDEPDHIEFSFQVFREWDKMGYEGRNKWVRLFQLLQPTESGRPTVTVTWKRQGGVSKWTFTATGLRPNIRMGSPHTASPLGVVPTEGALTNEWLMTDGNGRMVIEQPAGLWSPSAYTWSLEPVDAHVSSRDTASPYSPMHRSVRVWGTTYTMELVADLVPAADIFSMRAIDAPTTGWAAKAGRVATRGTESTLESLLPDIAKGLPQVVRLDNTLSPSAAVPNWEPWQLSVAMPAQRKWNANWGNPTILWMDHTVFGKWAMKNSIEESTVSAALSTFSTQSSDAGYRHVRIPAGTSLSSMLTVREGTNRRYRVEIPLEDVTWNSSVAIAAIPFSPEIPTPRLPKRN